jgi:hypothetical protein
MLEEQFRDYQKMLALLEAALNNAPAGQSVREELVREHNQRVSECENIFGQPLQEFSIHDADLRHTVTQYVPGIGSRPISSERVCDRGLYLSKVEGLWSYLKSAEQSAI